MQQKKVRRILKEGRRAKQASAFSGGSVNDNAESICWFCHADVSSLKNNKCAGCRKVNNTPLCPQNTLFLQARYCGGRCQRADWGRHGDYCVAVQEKIWKKIEAERVEQEIAKKAEQEME